MLARTSDDEEKDEDEEYEAEREKSSDILKLTSMAIWVVWVQALIDIPRIAYASVLPLKNGIIEDWQSSGNSQWLHMFLSAGLNFPDDDKLPEGEGMKGKWGTFGMFGNKGNFGNSDDEEEDDDDGGEDLDDSDEEEDDGVDGDGYLVEAEWDWEDS